jgi:hypothetical protein
LRHDCKADEASSHQFGDVGDRRGYFVIFCRQDGLTIPFSGLVLLRRLDSRAEIFDIPGTFESAVELISDFAALSENLNEPDL